MAIIVTENGIHTLYENASNEERTESGEPCTREVAPCKLSLGAIINRPSLSFFTPVFGVDWTAEGKLFSKPLPYNQDIGAASICYFVALVILPAAACAIYSILQIDLE